MSRRYKCQRRKKGASSPSHSGKMAVFRKRREGDRGAACRESEQGREGGLAGPPPKRHGASRPKGLG